MKKAVISMDVEDWYHLDYFDRNNCNQKVSMLDGFGRFREILNNNGIKTTFFVLGEIVHGRLLEELVESIKDGHEIANHGWNHKRPLQMSIKEFRDDLARSKAALEDLLQIEVKGYRAPCFSLDIERLNVVHQTGHLYDSSCMRCVGHPLYGNLDLSQYQQLSKNIYTKNGFFEFEVSSAKAIGRNIPVSGGGYIRIFPWFLMKWLLMKYLENADLYILYIHPFELSQVNTPTTPPNTKWSTNRRFSLGRHNVDVKLNKLISLLKQRGFEFTTFNELRNDLVLENLDTIL